MTIYSKKTYKCKVYPQGSVYYYPGGYGFIENRPYEVLSRGKVKIHTPGTKLSTVYEPASGEHVRVTYWKILTEKEYQRCLLKTL